MVKRFTYALCFLLTAVLTANADDQPTPSYLWGHIFAETTGTNNGTGAYDVITTSDAVYTASNYYTKGTDASASTLLWDGEVAAYGAPNSSAGGNVNALFTKLDKKGTVQWHVYTNMGKVNDVHLAAVSDGGVVGVAEIDHTNKDENKNGILVRFVNADGTTTQIDKEYVSGTSGMDFVVFKLTANGKVDWTKVLTVNETSSNIMAEFITVDDADNIYLAGYHWDAIKVGDTEIVAKSNGEKSSTSSAETSDFIIKLDKDGNYQKALASTGTFTTNQCYGITYANGALYLLGLAKTASTTDVIKLGDKEFTPGTTLSTYYTAKLSTDLVPQWVKSYYSTTTFVNSKGEPSKKTHANNIKYQDGKLLFTGDMNGGIAPDASTEHFFTTPKDAYIAFYGMANAEDGTLMDARMYTTPNISRYFDIAVIDGKVYAVGYDFSQGILLSVFTDNESSNYYLGTGSGTPQAAVIDGNNVYSSIRGKEEFTMLDGTKLTTDITKWAVVWAGFSFESLVATGVDNVVATQTGVLVGSVPGAVRINAGDKERTVDIHNTVGQLVKSVRVAGTTEIALPAGLYIVAGHKVAVK